MSMQMQYAVKRRMAKGGAVTPKADGMPKPDDDFGLSTSVPMAAEGGCVDCRSGSCMAHGGDVVDRIMKRMSEGGMIANDTDDGRADTQPAQFDDLVARDDLEFAETGANSGDLDGAPKADMDGDDDIVERVMKRIKQTMPRTGDPGYPE